ncbi:MAG: protein kinase [Deltaproteobacteria bacterium]|nr:protein kinase [Deltaproteobacteria bacterium]
MPAPDMTAATVTCGACRREFATTALFCPNCGTPKVAGAGTDALLGKLLGDRFLVQERIGQGGSGTIYRAEHVTLRRKVAIKVLHHELSRDDLAIERFRREATMVAEIDNDHIVEIHDFGRTPDGRLYLAMELLEGETLDEVLAKDGKLPVDRVADILIQVGEALIEAHAIGYVHRDLRPRNVYLAVRRGRANFVKLLDFGLAKIVENEAGAASTSLGMTFGDPRYMSPEQARGDRIDRRADIYQLGCVAYEMLTGAPPFVGAKVFDVLSRHVSEAARPIAEVRPETPPWLAAVIMRALAKRPEDRFATVSRMVEALRQGSATGAVMADAVARTREAELPASVSRVMEKLQIERAAIEDDDDAADVPVVAAPVVAPVAPVAPVVDEDLRKTTPHAPAKPAPVEAPVEKPSGGVARGKARPNDSAGISQVWFQDGEQLDGGAALDDSQAVKLQRARDAISPSSTGLIDEYDDRRRKPIGLYAAIGAGAVLLIAVVALAWPSKKKVDGDSGTASGAGTGSQVAVVEPADAGVAEPAAGFDAGAPIAIDAGVAKPLAGSGSSAVGSGSARGSGATTPRGSGASGGSGASAGSGSAGSGGGSAVEPADDEDKKKAEFFAKLGEQALAGGDTGGAAANFKKALELDPKSLDAIIGMGQIALDQGLYADAAAHLKKAAKLAPKSAKIQTMLGEAYLNSGNAKLAADTFKRALQLDPDNARARDGYTEAAGRLPPPTDDP